MKPYNSRRAAEKEYGKYAEMQQNPLRCGSRKPAAGNREEKRTTLKEVACGTTVRVKRLTGEGPVKRRIMDMGITKGAEIFVRKVAPLGDPAEITVRGYELSLRKADAEMIEVEMVEGKMVEVK